MSEAMDTNTSTIYVNLLDEGVSVVRPTQGLQVGRYKYRILATSDYDPDEEIWEFAPGSIVRCEQEMREGVELLVAKELVST